MRVPTLTPAAAEHVGDRALLLRASPKHGCCGGHALLPVAEVGEPSHPDDYRLITIDDVRCYIDRRFGDEVASWTVDAVGPSWLRRLQLEGAEGLDPT